MKLSPNGGTLNLGVLAQATLSLNNKIRNRGMTASEIHFSRDAYDHENLYLNDKNLLQKQKDLRSQNHVHLLKSRTNKRTIASTDPPLSEGDLVFMKNSSSKHSSKEPHILMKKDPTGKWIVRKALHSSHFSDGPTNISPFSKTVSTKFIHKPKKPFPIDSDKDFYCDEDSPLESADYTKAAKWNPNPPDNVLECTPLLLKTPRLVDDDNVSLGSNSTGIHQESDPNLSPRDTDRDSILESSLEGGSQPPDSPFESPEHTDTGTTDGSHEEVSHPSQSSPSGLEEVLLRGEI